MVRNGPRFVQDLSMQSVQDATVFGVVSAVLHEDDFARRVAALGERANAAHPTTWRPNDPDKQHAELLVGELVRVDEGHTSYGPAPAKNL